MRPGKIGTRVQRVLLAVDCERYSRESLETAIHFASTLNAELQCVFLEDERLLQIADLPFTREVLTLNASERTLSSQSLLHSLRNYSQQVKEELEQQASIHQLHCSFHTVRANSYENLLRHSSAADLLLFGDKPFGLIRRSGTSNRPVIGDVGVFLKGMDSDQRLLGTATSLAGREHRNLKIYVTRGRALTDKQLTALLGDYRAPAKIETFDSITETLQSLAQANHWQTLVLPFDTFASGETVIDRLLEQPGRRIILVR